MDIETDLKIQFELYGSIEGKVLEKCVQICKTYDENAEDLFDQWAAYCASSKIDGMPTIEALGIFERKMYMKRPKQIVSTPTAVPVYKNELQETISDDLVINSYSTPKSNQKYAKRIKSPDEETKRTLLPTEGVKFSPKTYSPSLTSQSHYAERSDSGNAMSNYGLEKYVKKSTFKRLENEELIPVKIYTEKDFLTCDARYMYEVMNAKATGLNNICEWIGRYLIKKYSLEDPTPISKSSGTLTTYGRISCDSNGKLNAASIILESSQELGRGATIQLNLSKISNYALFPGQVVAVQGFSPNGNNFVVQKIYTDASQKIPSNEEQPITFKDSLQIIVAAGPFTIHDDMDYKPLLDLIKAVASNPPHVLILIGPFVDSSHVLVQDCTMAESFDTFFETLLQGLMKPLEGLNVQVILVPSQKDVFHHPVFPTLPYKTKKKYPNLHCIADPSIVNINGLLIGATSVDVLRHLGKEEICSSHGSDRMSRLASYLLGQQSFYPLYPQDDDVSVDHELLEQYGMMDVLPHILIIPSNLRCFIKQINGCVVINPERLAKGYVGGTFCKLEVFKPQKDEIVADSIVAKVIRI